MAKRTCTIDGCDRPHQARGYCIKHYNAIIAPNRNKVTRNCDECGREYTTTRSNGKYCSLKCRDVVMKRERRGVFRVRLPRPRGQEPYRSKFVAWIIPCRWCGRQFTGVSKQSQYCSPMCQGKAMYGPDWIPQTVRAKSPLTCAHCGETFHSPYAMAIYCSSHCQRAAARARGADWKMAWITPARRTRLYERDHYICYICGIKTNRDGDMSTDPSAPTLDHVVPRSKGGKDDDANLRCCCRRCNSVKSDRDLFELQAELDLRVAS